METVQHVYILIVYNRDTHVIFKNSTHMYYNKYPYFTF